MLSEIAIRDPQSFKQLAEIARKSIGTIKKVVGTEK
jgi:ribosomal protein L20